MDKNQMAVFGEVGVLTSIGKDEIIKHLKL
jgi:hypothetical protein